MVRCELLLPKIAFGSIPSAPSEPALNVESYRVPRQRIQECKRNAWLVT
jgi:hypothetical protein